MDPLSLLSSIFSLASADDVFGQYRYQAKRLQAVAVVWHVLILVAVFLWFGRVWRPSRRVAGFMLSMIGAIHCALAWSMHNTRDGVIWSLACFVWITAAQNMDRGRAGLGRKLWVPTAGVALVLFGLWYPGFVDFGSGVSKSDEMLWYLLYAPVIATPQPTLAVLAGWTLTFNGLMSNAWCFSLAAMCAGYGVWGVLVLGNFKDAMLVYAALFVFVCRVSETTKKPDFDRIHKEELERRKMKVKETKKSVKAQNGEPKKTR